MYNNNNIETEKGGGMTNNQTPTSHHHQKCLPKRIILVRHGESEGNLDGTAYTVTPDHKIPLTQQGIDQSKLAGTRIKRVISDDGRTGNWRVYFYVSPYERTRSTLREIGRAFSKKRVIGAREEVRVREQDFGNFQVAERMKAIKETRERYGRFFYRFPEGESAADVFDRVSSFLESLWRDIELNRLHHDPADDLNLVIVTHGLASRVFLMKWFKWTVEQFEYLNNPGNAEFRVMQLGLGGEYSLAIHHTEDEMLEWGLSPEMIADQKWRAHACRSSWSDKCTWYIDSFFDNLAEDSAEESDHSEEESYDRLEQINHFAEESNHSAEESTHGEEESTHGEEESNHGAEESNQCEEELDDNEEGSNKSAEDSNHSVEDPEDIAEEQEPAECEANDCE